MERVDLLKIIENNLMSNNITDFKIYLQKDLYGNGWKLAVISQKFGSMKARERKNKVLSGIAEHFEWLDLITEEEKEWVGPLPMQEEPSQLPLWPESLARGNQEDILPVFSTDLDDDLTKPVIVTFYSLRGGVGRSTALAHTGLLLSEMGYRVVCVDMDLEAPGLSSLFSIKESDIGERGVVSVLLSLDRREEVDFSEHLLQVPLSENLFLIPAGVPSAEYARNLRYVSPEMWYQEDYNPLRSFVDGLRNKLPFCPDVILLDARTGFSEMSGPLLFDLSDMAIVVFFPHPQGKKGTEIIVRGLLSSKVNRGKPEKSLTPIVRFLVSPVPSMKWPEVTKRYRARPENWIQEWMGDINTSREKCGKEPFYPKDITHFIEYSEAIATTDNVENDTRKSYDRLAEWIIQLLPENVEETKISSANAKKMDVLDDLEFSTGIAEQQRNLLNQFIRTELVNRALRPEIAIILGRKGTGKTALFRIISEGDKENSTLILHAPMDVSVRKNWMMNAEGFREVEKLISSRDGVVWRHFWNYYTLVAIGNQLGDSLPDRVDKLARSQIRPKKVDDFLDCFDFIIKQQRFGLMLEDALIFLDNSMSTHRILVLDGLDTGFGSSDEERKRRQAAIDGMFTFWAEINSKLKNFSFKIFLREDIWRGVHIQNKSHLHGRFVTLKWTDQASFIKVLLRQALESKKFRDFVSEHLRGQNFLDQDVNGWSENSVYIVWNLFVGERMKGGNTTFTRNWVWNRLSDANKDHSPRFLLQLFFHALAWERDEEKKMPYTRAIIRPRAMIACLEKVSIESLASIVEEFKELEELIVQLRRIQRSPFDRSEVGNDQHLELAREVGLLEAHDEDADGVSRYRVPDFYRLALGIARKGQL